jgi:aryl carrier-like protein
LHFTWESAESEIEDYLKIHLPEYSIPNSINRLENFPLNANGKVDRRRLAEYQKTDSVEIMSDKVLNIVLMIWEELLKNKVADLDENLFKIGADSLLAARFVAAINARCGIEVRMKEVFMNPSINALTKLVDKRKNTDIAEFVEEGEI